MTGVDGDRLGGMILHVALLAHAEQDPVGPHEPPSYCPRPHLSFKAGTNPSHSAPAPHCKTLATDLAAGLPATQMQLHMP